MIEPEAPKFQWGQHVSAASDLFNDGSFPDQPADALLVKAGDRGEIVQVGTHARNRHAHLSRRIQGAARGGLPRRRNPSSLTRPVRGTAEEQK